MEAKGKGEKSHQKLPVIFGLPHDRIALEGEHLETRHPRQNRNYPVTAQFVEPEIDHRELGAMFQFPDVGLALETVLRDAERVELLEADEALDPADVVGVEVEDGQLVEGVEVLDPLDLVVLQEEAA